MDTAWPRKNLIQRAHYYAQIVVQIMAALPPENPPIVLTLTNSDEHGESPELRQPAMQPIADEFARTTRIRKIRHIDLTGCECGTEVSAADIEAGDAVMQCKIQGCKTIWVTTLHSLLLFDD